MLDPSISNELLSMLKTSLLSTFLVVVAAAEVLVVSYVIEFFLRVSEVASVLAPFFSRRDFDDIL